MAPHRRQALILLAVSLLAGGTVACGTTIAGIATAPPRPEAQVRWRPVIQQVATDHATGGPSYLAERQSTNPAVQQSALDALRCGSGVADPLIDHDDPGLPLVTCDRSEPVKYLLGPTLIDGSQIISVTTGRNPNGVDYVLNLTFNSAGSKTWSTYTASHVNTSVAVVVDTTVVSAETIQEAIPGAKTQISGNFSQQQAEQLAQEIRG